MHGDRRQGPKPIGAIHREKCRMPPCAPLIKKRPWALELVVRHAPSDTHKAGGARWAAHAIRKIGDGQPRTLAEKRMLEQYPDMGTPAASSRATTPAPSEVGQEDGIRAGGY